MQQIGSPILELLIMQGSRPQKGFFRTLRETWNGFRRGGVGGGLLSFITTVADFSPNGPHGLGAALAAFRADPSTDPALREILEQLRRSGKVVEAVGDETIGVLSSSTGVSRAEVLARLSQALPAIAGSKDRRYE